MLATIYDDSKVVIVFAIEEKQYEKIMGEIKTPIGHRLYDSIPLSFTEPLAHHYSGQLGYQSPSVDKSTGTLTIKINVENPYGEIKDGMYTNVHMPFGENAKAILVKDSSIGTDQLGKYLYVVNDSDKIVYTPLKPEIYTTTPCVSSPKVSARTPDMSHQRC